MSTSLAQIVAPPARPRLRDTGCLIIVATVVLSLPAFYVLHRIMNWFAVPLGPWKILMFVPGLLVAPFLVALYIAERMTYRRELETWAATWICLRCGNRWIPEVKSDQP